MHGPAILEKILPQKSYCWWYSRSCWRLRSIEQTLEFDLQRRDAELRLLVERVPEHSGADWQNHLRPGRWPGM